MSKDPNDLLGFTTEGAGEFDPPETPPPGGKVSPYRKETFSVENFLDEKRLLTWMNRTRNIPLEAVDDNVVNKSYPAMIWLFRAAAISGDLKRTKAIEAWLNWAKPIKEKPPAPVEVKPNVASAAFGVRTPDGGGEDSE
jgi:hypothetical protein